MSALTSVRFDDLVRVQVGVTVRGIGLELLGGPKGRQDSEATYRGRNG